MFKLKNKKYIFLLVFQIAIIIASGIISKDIWYSIGISTIGVCFNLFVSLGKPTGFLFGLVYASTSGIFALTTGVYATFAFMIFLQAPMAVYSFVTWRKKQNTKAQAMKTMSKLGIALMLVAMLISGGIMYFVLGKLNSSSIFFDTIFFVGNVFGCILYAMYYKNAYIVTLITGICGIVLWISQMIITGSGFSLAALYTVVSFNSVIALYKQYLVPSKSNVNKISV